MGEIKSVKVDNWGVFFLQKLQNFFNKTDYCDLTLQFRDNSQLKVHRLVLSACTDFFNVLEQTCELIDDALVMPIELQADVVVPIVNFMYTGTLEFELKMYGKLLKTAKEMNMTVLLKLLEAHKRTMEGSRPSQQRPVSPKTKVKRLNAGSPSIAKYLSSPSTASSAQQRRVITSTASTTRRILTGNPMQGSLIIKQGVNYIQKRSPKLQKGPTRFESSDSNMQASTYESSFDAISYESKPLKEEELEYDEMQTSHTKNRSSPFEQLRKGYNNNKRPAISTFTSPPAKKPNIEDVKEFSEQQRMRKQIAAEYGDEAEYDGIMDDEFHNDDDDDEPVGGVGSASISTPIKPQNPQMQQQPQASIIIKQSPNEKPTIVVKDSSNSKMDHAKIISEVLRQYPHLVKSNKNIKLKIMPNPNGQAQKIIVKKEQTDSDSEQGKPAAKVQTLQQFSQMPPLLKTQISKPGLTVTSTRIENQTTAALVSNTAATTTTGTIAPTQKRRIDSKTMHSLIALGAENTTGPWLCLRCGVNGRPISIPSYRGFRRHLINTHKEAIDPALCEHCGWRSANNRSLHHHMVVEHKITSAIYVFPKCDHCGERCLDANVLNTHIVTNHPDAHKQQCIYCNKVFSKEMQLYTHMKTFHKKLAREDGVIDFSDEEMTEFEDEIKGLVPQPESSNNKKIKIISDISLPSTLLKLDEVGTTVEEEYTSDTGPKFVNADGNEMVLTAEQREEIMSQLEQDHHDGGVVMVLNETGFPTEGVIVGQEIKLETAEAFDDHNIYNEFSAEREGVESDFAGNENDNLTEESALEAVKAEEEQGEGEEEEETQDHNRHDSEHEERMEEDHMEWAENVISAHDVDEEEKDNADEEKNVEDEEKDEDQNEDEEEEEDSDKAAKQEEVKVSLPKQPAGTNKKEEESKTDDISLKLKMLTGDWSDDEIDEDGEDVLAEQPEKDKSLEQSDATEDIRKQTIEYERTQQQESSDKSNNKREEDLTSATETVTLEEETSQSAQSEKTDEHNKKSSGENLTQHSRPNLRKSTEDKVLLDASEGTKIKGKLLNPLKEKHASKEASARVENEEEAEEEQKKLVDFNGEDAEKPLNVKVTPPKKNVDDPLDSLEKGDDKSQAKNEIDSDKYEGIVTSTKSSKDDSLKTADKLKSIMSEWVDDEDDN